jgi:hypothetical protein
MTDEELLDFKNFVEKSISDSLKKDLTANENEYNTLCNFFNLT